MSETKSTPETETNRLDTPWEARPAMDEGGNKLVNQTQIWGRRSPIAVVYGAPDDPAIPLVRSAPDLLRALEETSIRICESACVCLTDAEDWLHDDICIRARRVIAKAKGETP